MNGPPNAPAARWKKYGCPTLAVILGDPDPELAEGEGESKDLRFVPFRLGWDCAEDSLGTGPTGKAEP
jgi:hypothetical protein